MSEMVEVQTSELIGPALDWAIAKIEGVKLSQSNWSYQLRISGGVTTPHGGKYSPSTNWSQGGPLIERYQIWLTGPFRHRQQWKASNGLASDWDYSKSEFEGPTPLIAAMRCFAAYKLGQAVMVPKELLA